MESTHTHTHTRGFFRTFHPDCGFIRGWNRYQGETLEKTVVINQKKKKKKKKERKPWKEHTHTHTHTHTRTHTHTHAHTHTHTHTHTFATVVAVFITSVISSAGCPQTLLLMKRCGGHQRTLSSSRHRVSQQPSPEKNRCRWTSGKSWSSKPKEKLKRKTERPGQNLNETDKEQDCQEGSHVELPCHMVFAMVHHSSTLWSEYTWHGGHKLEREARRGRRRRLLRRDSCVERESWSAADRCPEQSTCDGLLVCWVAKCLSPI